MGMKHMRLGAALAAAAMLAGCSGDDSGSPATVTVTAGGGAGATTAGGATDGAGTTGGAAGDPAATTVAPAQERTVEVDETKDYSGERTAYTLTVHRLVVHDYYVEAEITLINDNANEGLGAWYGSGGSYTPRLYDDRGRNYGYVADAGHQDSAVQLAPGEGMDAVLVFGGRVPDDAQSLTLDFEGASMWDPGAWNQVVFEVPLDGAR